MKQPENQPEQPIMEAAFGIKRRFGELLLF